MITTTYNCSLPTVNQINLLPLCIGLENDQYRTAGRSDIDPMKVVDQMDDKLFKSTGKYGGRFGGRFVPEVLIQPLNKLEDEFHSILHDPLFQDELGVALRDYMGRETPLYYAHRLTDYYNKKRKKGDQGPKIYLKREDLNHTGSYKMNNAIAQVMLAKRMGSRTVVAATGAGYHGVATAAACAKLSLNCVVFMSNVDIERQSVNMHNMKLLGAQVEPVQGSFKDAMSEAIRYWVGNMEDNYYFLAGTGAGPHPCPRMVNEFQSIIGKETRKQAMEKWGGKPDAIVACVGVGSNAVGIFHEFVRDKDVRLIGVEGAGKGIDSGNKHSATLAKGEVGVYHGAMSYLLQDDQGNVVHPHSIGVGLEYPGVSPELSFLKDTGRVEFHSVTDEEALDAYTVLCRLEGIFPALETAHALAYLRKLCPTLPSGSKVIVNCSGCGDKDISAVMEYEQKKNWLPTPAPTPYSQ